MRTKLLIAVLMVLSIVSCNDNNPTKSKYDIAIDNLMLECRNFDTESLLQGLPDEWELYSYLVYDDAWHTITTPYLFMGDMNCEGLGITTYVFNIDSTGYMRSTPNYPPFETIIYYFDWHYDKTNKNLVMNGESYNAQYTVSGFNRDYLVLDYYDSVNEHNTRKIFKRKE